jgi:hypothetical protein
MRRLQPLLSSTAIAARFPACFAAAGPGRLIGLRALATAAPAKKSTPPAFEFEPLFQADPFSATPYR